MLYIYSNIYYVLYSYRICYITHNKQKKKPCDLLLDGHAALLRVVIRPAHERARPRSVAGLGRKVRGRVQRLVRHNVHENRDIL